MKYEFVCKKCNKMFVDTNYVKKRIYCSKACLFLDKKPLSEKTKLKLHNALKGRISNRKGAVLSEKTKLKISKGLTGRKITFEEKLKRRESMLAEKSRFWKGGITSEDYRLRRSVLAKVWRLKVKERDSYTCQKCGTKQNIETHHIQSWRDYPELRFQLSNGLTLCKKCHLETDNYGQPIKNYQLA